MGNMPQISDREIYEGAQAVIDGHGGSALYVATGRLEDCRELGDVERVGMWVRIVAAVEALQTEGPKH